jgi:hypothetical protein
MYLYQMQVNLLPGWPKLSSSSTVPGLQHTEKSSVSSPTNSKPQGVKTALALLATLLQLMLRKAIELKNEK